VPTPRIAVAPITIAVFVFDHAIIFNASLMRVKVEKIILFANIRHPGGEKAPDTAD
jgi:hypothetical protein